MLTKARLLGHPIHAVLVLLPLGTLSMAAIFDVIGFFRGGDWSYIAYWMIGAGVISGLVAAPFGTIDLFTLPSNTRARTIGLIHAGIMVLTLALFAASWWLRRTTPSDPGVPALILSVCGLLTGFLGGWFGGELVNRLGVGVHEGAQLNSPSSLSGRPATEGAKMDRPNTY